MTTPNNWQEYRKIKTTLAMHIASVEDVLEAQACGAPVNLKAKSDESLGIVVRTLEGPMNAEFGDWLCKGVAGEYWAIKDSIFRESYVIVEPPMEAKSLSCTRPNHRCTRLGAGPCNGLPRVREPKKPWFAFMRGRWF